MGWSQGPLGRDVLASAFVEVGDGADVVVCLGVDAAAPRQQPVISRGKPESGVIVIKCEVKFAAFTVDVTSQGESHDVGSPLYGLIEVAARTVFVSDVGRSKPAL